MSKDITHLVGFGLNDDEYLPLTKCACGQVFKLWDFMLDMDSAGTECPNCKRMLYFRVAIRVFEV